MEIYWNYGRRSLLISDNWFYLLFFIVSFTIALRKNRKKNISLKDKENQNKDSNNPADNYPILSGVDSSSTLEKFCDQCLSKKEYFEITDIRLKKIIRKMLDVASNTPVIISTQVYLLALLKSQQTTVLTFNRGGTKLIIEGAPRFAVRSFWSIVMGPLVAAINSSIVMGILPIGLLMLGYSYFHIDCNSYLTSLPKLNPDVQYIEIRPNDDAAIIVAPAGDQAPLLYHQFHDSDLSTADGVWCYITGNCLGPEPGPTSKSTVPQRTSLKSKTLVPLSQRTRTLQDLRTSIDESDVIDVENVDVNRIRDKEGN